MAHYRTTIGYYVHSLDIVSTLDCVPHNMANKQPNNEVGLCHHDEIYFKVKQIFPQPDIEFKIMRYSYPCIAVRQFMSSVEKANVNNLGNMDKNKGVGGIKKEK